MANENFVVRHGLIVCGDVGIDTHLGVSGNTSVGGTLKVDNNTDLNGTLDVCGNTSVGGDLKVTGSTTVSTLTVEKSAIISTLTVSGNTTTSTLTVTGTLSAEDIDVSGNVTTSTLTVTNTLSAEDIDVSGSLGVSGSASFGSATVTGTLSAEDIDVSGNVTTSTLTVTGTLSAEDIDVSGSLGVSGNVSAGSATVTNTLTAEDIDVSGTLGVSGNTSLAGILKVDNNSDLNGTLDVSGNTSVGGGLTVTGNSDLNGTLGVCGNTSLGGNLTVIGTTCLEDTTEIHGSLTVSHDGGDPLAGDERTLTVKGDASFDATIYVDKLNVSGNTSFGGNLIITGNTDLNGQLGVSGNTSLAGILKVDNNSDLNGTLDVSGNASVGGTFKVENDTSLAGILTVTDATDLNSTLDVSGNASVGGTLKVESTTCLEGTLDVSGNASFGSNLTVTGTISAEDIDVSGSVTTSTLAVIASATISTLTVSGNTTTSTLTVNKTATISADTQVKTRLTVGSGHIGSRNPGFSVIGDADSSPLVVKTSGKGTVFAVLPWDTGITYIASGIYYDDGTWTHSSTDTTNCLFSIGGSQGANWYSSSNSTGSWNVASNVSLWNSTAQWDNQLSTNVTYNGNTIWHAGNDGSGSGLDADTLDGQQGSYYNQSQFTGSSFISRNSGNPIAIDSATTNTIGYTNSSSAAGYADGGIFSAAYSTSWVGQIFSNFRDGHISVRGKNSGTWQSWHTVWDSGNDGSGSGLDADLLDGLQLHTGRNNNANRVVRTDANGYIQAGWINSTSGTHSNAVTKVYSTYSGDSYIRYCTPDHLANSMSNVLHSNAADTASQRIGFQANATNNWDTIATSSGSQGCIEIYNTGSGTDAFMSFHVGGDYACYFGLDGGTNKLSVGGWSMGANSYEIYHSGNKPSLATLGFTGASNANYITNNNQLTNGAGYYSSGSSPTFSDAYNNGWWRNNNASEGLYNQSTQQHFYSASSTYWHLNSTNGVVFYTAYNASAGNATGRQGYLYWSSAGFGLLGAAGAWAVCIRSSGTDVIFGGPTTNNHYNSTSSARVSFGGGNDMANYHLGTNSENYGGTYTKLDLRWHTGIRMGAQSTYGGIRFFDTEDLGTLHFHIAGTSNYIYKYVWMYTNTTGYYSGTHSWHISPNDLSSYGSMRLRGTQGNNWWGMVIDSAYRPHVMFDNVGNGGFYFQDGGRWPLYYHRAHECTGINGSSTSSSYGLYVTGGIYSSSGNIYAASDARIKKDVKTIENALDKVLNLRGVTYIKTNKTEDDPNNGKTEIGVIAQEVLEVVPEVVNHAEDIDVYAVDYGNFAGLFIEAIKEQNEVINNLRQEVLNLKNQLGM